MPHPKRVQRRRIQVLFRRPNANERGPFGQSYADLGWYAEVRPVRADGQVLVRLTSRAHPPRGEVLQALICMALRIFPEATTADLCDLAGCSRETAHRRKLRAYQINADWDAKVAARRAIAKQRPSRSASGSG
jgi:hypothetical protein